MIDIEYYKGDFRKSNIRAIILLEGKKVGEILKVNFGFQYYPNGQKEGGDVFTSVVNCFNSLN